MTKEAFDRIKAGLEDALAYAQGDASRGVAHQVRAEANQVRAAREKLGLSQSQFAKAFGVSIGTLQGWEQGRRRPVGSARTLLTVIEREPEAAKRALEAG